MCIIFIAKNVHPEYPLIIAANRDEYFARPTQAPHWWPDAPHLFAGKDLQAGGTWLGHNKQNRVAGITNLRRPDLYQSGAKSRGDLVKRFLDIETKDTEIAIAEFTDFLAKSQDEYNPFNMVFGDAQRLVIFSSATGLSQEVANGVHSLSNGAPDEAWPKMQRGSKRLSEYLHKDQLITIEDIFSLLMDQKLSSHELLPETGIPKEMEYLLSSIYIPECKLNGLSYGTRSSSIICCKNSAENERVVMQSRLHN